MWCVGNNKRGLKASSYTKRMSRPDWGESVGVCAPMCLGGGIKWDQLRRMTVVAVAVVVLGWDEYSRI